MTMHSLAVNQPKQMLKNLAGWLDKAAAYAEERSFDVNNLVQARLAIDQYTLVRQIQAACDTAKFIPARLGGIAAPKQADDETTFAELQTRVRDTIAFLDSVADGSLPDFADKHITLPFLPEGSWVRGEDYLETFALPNFYHHLCMAYAILRHCGVPVGKRDFIGFMPIQSASSS